MKTTEQALAEIKARMENARKYECRGRINVDLAFDDLSKLIRCVEIQQRALESVNLGSEELDPQMTCREVWEWCQEKTAKAITECQAILEGEK